MISPDAPKTLWAWGKNNAGQLGLSDAITRSSPVQVGALVNWRSVSVGNFQSLATKTDGTLWAWGKNEYGQLGLGDYVYRSSPVQVGILATWGAIATSSRQSFALKTDGTLWSWGRNTGNGYLGLGDYVHYVGYPWYTNLKLSRSSPVQVGTLATWSAVSVGGSSFSLALKTDGTLWAWGTSGSEGYLGLGDLIKRSSPTQIGTLATWSQIGNGSRHSLAIKTDGTLWAWGHNVYGQHGLADFAARSSPAQVGTLATWTTIAQGNQALHSLGLHV